MTAQSWAWVDAATDWQQCTWSGCAEEVLSTGAKHARVVHQNRNRHAKGPREEGLPEVEGPVGTIAANVTQKAQRCIMDFTGLGVLGFGLEKLHLSPKNRGVSHCTVFLG